jgi:hypothetical protein
MPFNDKSNLNQQDQLEEHEDNIFFKNLDFVYFERHFTQHFKLLYYLGPTFLKFFLI